MSKDYKIKRMRRKKRMAEIERDNLEAENAALRERVAELEGVVDGWVPISWASSCGDAASDRRVRIDAVTGAFYDGTKYAVRDGSMVLSKSGEWEYEPMPSSRDDDFYARCRFDTLAEAALAASKRAGGEGE